MKTAVAQKPDDMGYIRIDLPKKITLPKDTMSSNQMNMPRPGSKPFMYFPSR